MSIWSIFSIHFPSCLHPSFIHEPVQPLHIKMWSSLCEGEIDIVLRRCQNCLSGASWMGFLCRAAAHELKITMQNGKCQVKYCEAHFYSTGAVKIQCLEWWFMLCHTAAWRMNLDLADVRWTLHAWMSGTNCKVWWRGNIFDIIQMYIWTSHPRNQSLLLSPCLPSLQEKKTFFSV